MFDPRIISAPPQQRSLITEILPAPSKGVDSRIAFADMSSQNCIFTYNLDPVEYGMKIRPGFSEWQISIEATTGLGVKTMIPVSSVSANKLFAVTNEGIWDVTVDNGTPVRDVTFTTDTSAEAGHGVFLHRVLANANEWVFYADSKNGLYEYNVDTDTWAAKTDITGVAETDIAFIMQHKQRIWMIEEDSAKAWYLGVGAIAGAATAFDFGDKFQHGGTLRALINWTIDGGDGIDDYLVAVSSTGDVVVYRGADPSTLESAAPGSGWAVVGSYFIGELPKGRRFFNEHSGELYLLSSFGVISMRDLLNGVQVKDAAQSSLTFPISSILRAELSSSSASYGWEPIFLPTFGRLLISSPQDSVTGEYIQYSMSLATQGWGFWRGVPVSCFVEWNNKIYFGTEDNKVYVMGGTRDYVLNDTGAADANGFPVAFSMLTAYSHANHPGMYKIGQYVRPQFLKGSTISYRSKILYDYEIGEQIFGYDAAGVSGISLWDSAVWDTGLWESDSPIPESRINGASGIGRTMAVALRGESGGDARLISFDVGFTPGGEW